MKILAVLQVLKETLQSSIKKHRPSPTRFSLFKYIGPGFLVTVGFIDPGNWATNIAAGSSFGYSLLWVVSIGTIFIIVLQHGAARLGIVTGYCLAEAATLHVRPWVSRTVLVTAMLAGVATEFAEILGAGIALNMLFRIPIILGAGLVSALVIYMLFTNSYRRLERWIIGFLSLIGLSFIIELGLVGVDWSQALAGAVSPSIPDGSAFVLLGILGAIVMPTNLFLHSEIIQSRQWNMENGEIRESQLKFEFVDTILSMLAGWAINCAIIIVAAATFFAARIPITELYQAQQMLVPLAGNAASIIFAIALLASGISAAVTCGMAGGSTYTGIFGEAYDIKDPHTKWGIVLTIIPAAALIIFLAGGTLQSLVLSQVVVSVQLPLTIFLLIYLTSSERLMGRHKNTSFQKAVLWLIGAIVVLLDIALLIDAIH